MRWRFENNGKTESCVNLSFSWYFLLIVYSIFNFLKYSTFPPHVYSSLHWLWLITLFCPEFNIQFISAQMLCNIWVFDAEKENVLSRHNRYSSSGINKIQLLLSQLPIYAPIQQTSDHTVFRSLEHPKFQKKGGWSSVIWRFSENSSVLWGEGFPWKMQ